MRSARRFLGRVGLVIVLVATMAVVSISTGADHSARVDASPILGYGGEYHPLKPARILDTRGSSRINDRDQPGAKAVRTGSGNRFDVRVLGQGGLPAAAAAGDVLAVAVSITVVDPTVGGYLQAWGKGSDPGTSSIVNFERGDTVPNMAILRPGAGGEFSIRLVSGAGSGTAHVLIDVVGWFSTSNYATQGSRLIPVGPGRVYDSREAPRRAPLGARETIEIQIRGASSRSPNISPIVPNASDVSGVLVNITGVNNTPSSTNTFISALAIAPSGMPTTSNLNLRSGQEKANLALVPIGPDGKIRIYNQNGQAHVIVDVVAYMQPRPTSSREGRVIPLAVPFRVLDTRLSAFGGAKLGPGRGEDWNFTDFVNDVRIGSTPLGAQSGFLGNFTATDLTRPSGWFTPVTTYLTVFPRPTGTSTAVPTVSNLNLPEGVAVPNMALFRYGSGESKHQVRVYNYNGDVHYLVDVSAVILAD